MQVLMKLLKKNKIDIDINFDDVEKTYRSYQYSWKLYYRWKSNKKYANSRWGDPFNKILFEKSISDMKSENLFKSVNYNVQEISDKSKIIDIKVEEKPTGEIFAGAGTGTTGITYCSWRKIIIWD